MAGGFLHFGTGSRSLLLRYGSIHFGKTLLWVGEDALALFMMVRVLELPPALAGVLFLASAFLNAACDGIFGKLMSSRTGLAETLPPVLWGAVLLSGLSFALLPFMPVGAAVSVAVILLVFRLSFSLADVPHNALTLIFTQRYGHLTIARIRAILSGAASMVIAVVAFLVLSAAEHEMQFAMALIAMVGVAAIALMSPLPRLVGLEWADPAEAIPFAPSNGEKGRISFLLFCLSSALGIAALAVLGKAILHIEFEIPALGAAALILITAGRLGSIWIWSPIARRIGNRRSLSAAYFASGCMAFLVPSLASSSFGLGTGVLLMMAGLTGGGVAMLSWACLSELVVARTVKGGRAAPAGFAWFTMSTKVALGLSGVLVGAWLSTKGAPAHSAPSTFGILANIVFCVTTLTAALIYRKPHDRQPAASIA